MRQAVAYNRWKTMENCTTVTTTSGGFNLTGILERSALVNIRRKDSQGRTVFCFYITLRRYFKLEIIYESASLFNLKEKKLI